MIHIKPEDHVLYDCDYAKEMREVLDKENYGPAGLALAVDLKEMKGHYHKTFDEIYYLLDGSMDVKCYDPEAGKTWTEHLEAGDTLTVPKGIHHAIPSSSPENKLMVFSIPPWYAEDENPSDEL